MLETLLPPQTYFSIGEVSQLTQVKPYVIRYWESQFGLLRPPRRDSGQRKFTQKEIGVILRIKDLLYDKRFTIAGAKRHLQQENRRAAAAVPSLPDTPMPAVAAPSEVLRSVRKDLEDALQLLQGQ